MTETPRPLLFDLDGTLVDSAPGLRNALNRFLATLGRRSLDLAEVKALIGDGSLNLVAGALAATGDSPRDAAELAWHLDAYLAIYQASAAAETTAFPRVADTLAALAAAGHPMAVCTNKPERPSRAILEGLGLAANFDVVAGGDTLPVRKPDPGHLFGALDRLGSTRERAVMIGDNEHDAAAGRAAGLPVVLVTYGYARLPLDSLGAACLIDDFAALPAALDAL